MFIIYLSITIVTRYIMMKIIQDISTAVAVELMVVLLLFVIKAVIPNDKVKVLLRTRNIVRIVLYLSSITLIVLLFLLLPLGKWFVLSICLLVAFIVYMVVFDVINYKMSSMVGRLKKEQDQSERAKKIDELLDLLSKCDDEDKKKAYRQDIRKLSKKL